MPNASTYRDPFETAARRISELEREKAELVALTAGARRALFRRRAGVAVAFAVMLVAAPTLAWIVRGRMPPPPPATRTYEGRYTLHPWTPVGGGPATGPLTLTVDPATGLARGRAEGPMGSVRITGQMHDRDVEVIAFSADGDGRGLGSAKVIGDAISGSFGVPKMAASASFAIEQKR